RLNEIRIDGSVAVSVVLPDRTSASIINPRANVARLSSIKKAATAQVIESIIRNVLEVRVGSLSKWTQSTCATIGAGLLKTPGVIILVSAIEPFVGRIPGCLHATIVVIVKRPGHRAVGWIRTADVEVLVIHVVERVRGGLQA